MMDFDKTMFFKVEKNQEIDSKRILKDVYEALVEKGYNPINQIVGYIISGDPGYISNYQDARRKMLELDRSELVAVLLKEYLEKWAS